MPTVSDDRSEAAKRKLNPGDRHWDERVSNVIEQSSEDDSEDYGDKRETSSALNELEQSTEDKSKNMISRDPTVAAIDGESRSPINSTWTGPNPKDPRNVVKILKKGGPGIILGVLLGIAGVIGFFGGPSMLLINFAETLTDKLNFQMGFMDSRYAQIVKSKISNTTSGPCVGGASKVLCKYSTFSQKEIDNFKKAGLKVNSSGETIAGRVKVDSFELSDGRTITASNFDHSFKNVPEFRDSMIRSYSLKYSSMADDVFNRVANKFRTSKASRFKPGSTDDERLKVVQAETKNGAGRMTQRPPCTGDSCSQEVRDSDAANQDGVSKQNDVNQGSADKSQADAVLDENRAKLDNANPGELDPSRIDIDGVDSVARGAADDMIKTAGSIIKITGPIDNVCMVYGWVKTISYVSKVGRAAQMARYAMIFLTTASMIRAGDALPEDVEFLSNNLMKTVSYTDDEGNVRQTKTATESFGYRHVNYGDKGIDETASTAVAGASFGGKIQSAVSTLLMMLGTKQAADQTCKILSNPFVQVGSLAAGIGGLFVGGTQFKFTVQAAIAPLVALAGAFLPAMIGDISSGNLVTDTTFGERSGNFITSGTSVMLGSVANFSGGSVLKRSQAVDYIERVQNETMLAYADYDRRNLSPFDVSSPNTMMGSIYTQLTPYLYGSASSPVGVLGKVGDIVLSSFSNLSTPTARAVDAEAFSECKDIELVSLDIATDPFCNPIIGIPPEFLNISPIEVLRNLLSRNMINEDGGFTDVVDPEIGMSYRKYVERCIERSDPYGATPDEQTVDDTDKCFIKSQSQANLHLFKIDSRTIKLAEEELPKSANSSAGSDSSGDSSSTTSGQPVNAEGWTSPVAANTPITSPFGPRASLPGDSGANYHYGLDFGTSVGTPIYAIRDGTVTGVGTFPCEGQMITLKHDVSGQPYTSMYMHLSRMDVANGASVTAGQTIGASGATGTCQTGPHLHLQLMDSSGSKIDPAPYVLGGSQLNA